jgi:hypothetical protein
LLQAPSSHNALTMIIRACCIFGAPA